MKSTDLVDLVILTPHNYLYVVGIDRKAASDVIRVWFDAREEFSQRSWLTRAWKHFRSWLSVRTLAVNHPSDDQPGVSFAHWAIGAESILGMYIREREQITNQERLVAAQEKIAAAVENSVQDSNRGDEWRDA